MCPHKKRNGWRWNDKDRVSPDVCLGYMTDVVEKRQGYVYSREQEKQAWAFLLGLICGMMSKRVSLHLLHVPKTPVSSAVSLIDKEPMMGGCKDSAKGEEWKGSGP